MSEKFRWIHRERESASPSGAGQARRHARGRIGVATLTPRFRFRYRTVMASALELEATTRLHALSTRLLASVDLAAALDDVLQEAIAASRAEIAVTFLALLELIRMKQVSVLQSELFGEIEIRGVSS